jgi:hypothetical protein
MIDNDPSQSSTAESPLVLPPEWDFFLRLQAGSLRSANDAHLSGMREFLKSAGDREATQSAVLFPLLYPLAQFPLSRRT